MQCEKCKKEHGFSKPWQGYGVYATDSGGWATVQYGSVGGVVVPRIVQLDCDCGEIAYLDPFDDIS